MPTMFQTEEQRAADLINDALETLGHGRRVFEMRPIPFSGVWGTFSSVSYQIANEQQDESAIAEEGLSKKETKRRAQGLIREKAQEIATQVAERLAGAPGFAGVTAENGYINVVFDTNRISNELVRTVRSEADDYGRGEPKTARVMVEFSQPNTHKEFHVGHLRNASLGNALSKILRFSGYELLTANYIGDIGMHVIKTLWCYRRFHQGDEPPLAERGRWLGELYAESDQRLRYRDDVVALLNDLSHNDQTFVEMVDRMMKQLWKAQAQSEDIAYLLGQLAHARDIKTDALYNDETIEKFWPILGNQLRTELAEAEARDAEAGEPEPNGEAVTPVETYRKRVEQWERLGLHLDWWPDVPEWQREVRETFQLWEKQDPGFVALWEETKSWSMEGFQRIYDQLDIDFDVWFFESQVEEPGREMVKELLERGIAEVSDGLPVVKIDEKLGLEKETYRTLPVLRSDGTTLYSTKDLALTRIKFDEYGVDQAIWVVDVRQSLYFQQIFKILELWGFSQAANCLHLGYEMVSVPGGAMSSRLGNAVLYDDLAADVLSRAREIIDEKNPTLPAELKDQIAQEVGLGSLKYGMLMRDNNRVIVFDIEEALSFDGHAAPYIQY
ncbi:MAG TPA: arginine--tRNA ligase, partial [Thermomicrobiaceae bacterium]|nr:arginine--tRNA ligase [Thermomicrobiaceae bacterium]